MYVITRNITVVSTICNEDVVRHLGFFKPFFFFFLLQDPRVMEPLGFRMEEMIYTLAEQNFFLNEIEVRITILCDDDQKIISLTTTRQSLASIR